MVQKDISELERNAKKSETLKEWAEEMMQFLFTRSQENLAKMMPWGDYQKASDRKPSRIWDQGWLARSSTGPFWKDDNTITLEYDSPYAVPVEYGTPPHRISPKHLIGWARRKLNKRGKAAVSVAFAISNKISKEGTDPHPFLRPAVHDMIIKYNLKITGPKL